MKSILITGANRGIGLGLVKELVSSSSSPELIFAGYRDANKSKELLDLAKQHSNTIIPVQIDVSDDESVNKAKVEVEKKLGNNRGLNCLLNNAGVNNNIQLNEINEKDMFDTYKHNVLGPWRVTKAFLPLVEKAVAGERNVLQASIINVSSTMSSSTLASNRPFFAYDYMCSKTALNMYTVCLATELAKSNIFITLLHPGWVQTDMGGSQARLTVEQASKNIVQCITAMKNEHYGKLIDSTGGSKCTYRNSFYIRMKSVLITGANRGIGYGLVKQFLTSKSDHIFATYRQMDRSKELFDLAKQHTATIIPLQLDTIDDTSIQKAVEKVEQRLNGKDLNCLINNAGMASKLRFADINEKDMMETYRQNVIGPWKVTKAFLPLLEKSALQLKQRDIKQSSIINISSIMSSLELSKTLPYYYYDYQCSKVALNMLTVCMGKDLEKKKIFFSLLHPGWVKTDMGTSKAPLTPDAAAKNIFECLQAMTNEHYCKLIDARDGKKVTVIPF